MKGLIVFYSMGGNTAYAAGRIGERTGADLLRLEPLKKYPDTGFRKFLWGGKSAVMAEKPELVPYQFDADKYDMIVFGFPVWAGNITPPIRTFIHENRLVSARYAAFACQSGSGAEKAFGKLEDCLGYDLSPTLILIDPKDKPDPEEDRRIDEFCDLLTK